jgi:hypothetical protein
VGVNYYRIDLQCRPITIDFSGTKNDKSSMLILGLKIKKIIGGLEKPAVKLHITGG